VRTGSRIASSTGSESKMLIRAPIPVLLSPMCSAVWAINEVLDILAATSAVHIPTTAKFASEGTLVTLGFCFMILGLLNVLLFFHEAFAHGA